LSYLQDYRTAIR